MKSLLTIVILLVFAVAVTLLIQKPETDNNTQDNKTSFEISLSSESVFVYDGVSVPVDTKVLDLSNQGFDGSLKAEIRQLTDLRELDVSNNNFTGIPAEVGQLSELEVLNLSDNPITGLPYEIGKLSKLKLLDLRGTQYSKPDLQIINESLPAETRVLVDY